jgi:hypothetical protein
VFFSGRREAPRHDETELNAILRDHGADG